MRLTACLCNRFHRDLHMCPKYHYAFGGGSAMGYNPTVIMGGYRPPKNRSSERAIAFGVVPPLVPPPQAQAEREPRGDPHLRSTSEVTGYSIHATDGDIGHVDDFIVDDGGWSIRYVVVSRSWLGKKVILSPDWIERVSWEESSVFVRLTREAIKDAPEWDDAQPITREFEERLYGHHERRPYWPTDVLR